MLDPDMLSVEEWLVLLWMADSGICPVEFAWAPPADHLGMDAVIDQLVNRGLLDREFMRPVNDCSGLFFTSAHLTTLGVQVVTELRRRQGQRERSARWGHRPDRVT
jgi:hypothetical protein